MSIANAPVIICGVAHPHVRHPDARNQWSACANCLNPIWVGPDPQPATLDHKEGE